MRTLSSPRPLVLCPLLLAALLAHTQQRRQDTLILHFAIDKFDTPPAEAAKPGVFFHDSLFNAKNIDSVLITGYTDKTGTLVHNQHLSAQRAAAAGAWLRAELGASDSVWRLTSGGIAPTPERSDSDNRRAEIFIYYHLDPPPPADTATALHRDSTQPATVVSLRHINFIVDTPVPTAATRDILPSYVAQLRQYADRRMEIDGFCNSLTPLSGPDDPLFILSVKRAKFIYDYLVDAGFDPARLTYKGMGNASPINADPVTKQDMDANMRVEIKIF